MGSFKQITGKITGILVVFLPIIAFIPPFAILYSIEPALFEQTWKGRTFYLFFIWLASLEIILNWENFQKSHPVKLKSIKTITLIAALTLPTIYVIVANYYGLNTAILDWATKNFDAAVRGWMALSVEYLVLTCLFVLIVSLDFGITRLKDFSISTLFLGAIAIIYTIDNLYPFGKFTPFQAIVPTTANLAALTLNQLGYSVAWLGNYANMPTLEVRNALGHSSGPIAIAWPCSGVESLIIFTVTILLFLRQSAIPMWQRIVYFVVGAVVTYFINIWRIVTIFLLSMEYGFRSIQVQEFHGLYGSLYSITWIVSYPLVITGSRLLWSHVKSMRSRPKKP